MIEKLFNTLPKYSHTQVSLLRRLGRGRVFNFQSDHGPIKLWLNSAPHVSSDKPSSWIKVTTTLGDLWLDEKHAESLLNWLSRMPYIHNSERSEQRKWEISLFQQQLYSEVKNSWGLIESEAQIITDPPPAQHTLNCIFTWQHQQTTQGSCHTLLSETMLSTLLNKPEWSTAAAHMALSWPIRHAIKIGTLSLSYQQLFQLKIGDVLLPDHCFFSVEGEGRIRLGSYFFDVVHTPHGTNWCFLITQKEDHLIAGQAMESTMNEEHLNDEINDSAERQDDFLNGESKSGPFDALQSQLTVQTGHIVLTLAELNQLQTGQILTVEGEQAGTASLYHGKTLVARGDLVNVDGQLGLQLTQLMFQATQQESR